MVVRLKIDYNNRFKKEHLDKYGETNCNDVFNEISKVIDTYVTENYLNCRSRFLYQQGNSTYLNLSCDRHIEIKYLIDKLKEIEAIGKVGVDN